MLTEEDKRRIEEEEVYRAQVRQSVKIEEQKRDAPNYWTGFILDLLIIGLGHLVIGEVLWGVIWFALAVFLSPITGFIAWPFIAVGVLIHYRNLYAKKYS